jgi:hypothetical protein
MPDFSSASAVRFAVPSITFWGAPMAEAGAPPPPPGPRESFGVEALFGNGNDNVPVRGLPEVRSTPGGVRHTRAHAPSRA